MLRITISKYVDAVRSHFTGAAVVLYSAFSYLKSLFVMLSVTPLLFYALPASGDFGSYWYADIGAGSTFLSPAGSSAGFSLSDDSSSGIKLSLGQQFKRNWSWEASYIDAGEAGLSNPNPALQALIPDAALEYKVVTGFANYYLKDWDSRFNYFAKVGFSSISNEANDDRIAFSKDSSVQFSFGGGVQLRFGKNWFARLEYESYSKDASYTGLSLGYLFGQQSYQPPVRQDPVPQPVQTLATKSMPVVIEYPIYEPEKQAAALVNTQTSLSNVEQELQDLSDELKEANPDANYHVEIVTAARRRIAIVEESILKAPDYNDGLIDDSEFVSASGEPLLVTIAEQATSLQLARSDLSQVAKAIVDLPSIEIKLSRIDKQLAVVEKSLLYGPKLPKAPAELKPVVVEYPIYEPEEQVAVLHDNRESLANVEQELLDLSAELAKASENQAGPMAEKAELLNTSRRKIAIVEESILKAPDVISGKMKKADFVTDAGTPLLATPAEQSAELGDAKQIINRVEGSLHDMPETQEKLSGVQEQITIIEQSLLYVPPWEQERAADMCKEFEEKEGSIEFRSESTRLTRESKQVLAALAEKMNKNLRIIIEVQAHTDSWGTFKYNQELSERRARRAKQQLVELGISEARVRSSGYGELKPIDTNKTKEGRARNRRVDIIVNNPNICQ